MIQQHPDYHDGFFDALDTIPIDVTRSAEYRAGWFAYWRVHDELDKPDFIGSPDEAWLPMFREQVFH